MKPRICGLLAITASVACLLGSTQTLAQNVSIPNEDSNNVPVNDTATNAVTTTIPVGASPVAFGVFI